MRHGRHGLPCWILPRLLVIALTLLAAGCAEPPSTRVILVGIDGADWNLIDAWIASGRLTAFARLRDEGLTGTLVSDYSTYSPAVWTSIATGKLPAKHGIEGFLARSARSYYQMPVSSFHRRSAALWNILDHHGLTTSVVGWWASWPAETVRGHVVSQRFFLSSFGVGPIGGDRGIGVGGENPGYAEPDRRLTWPEELAAELDQRLDGVVDREAAGTELGQLLAELGERPGDAQSTHDVSVVDNIHRTDLLVAETFAFLGDTAGPSDLTAIYFESVDVASHLFWKHLFPEAWQSESGTGGLPRDHRRYAPIIPLVYGEIDRMLGRILDELDDRTLLVVVSDHGFGSHLDPHDFDYTMNGLLAELDLATRRPDGGVDHSGTLWFDHGGHPWENRRELFLNVRGQFPRGSVAPEDAPRLQAQLQEELVALRTFDGQPVVIQTQPLQDGTGLQVRIHPRLDRDARVIVRGRERTVMQLFPPRTLSGNHRPEGIVAFYGRGIGPGRLDAMSSLDVTPTLLPVLGLPIADDMDGKPCARVLDELGATTERVDSFDFLAPDAQDPEVGSSVDEALRERLRSLGYID